jgi:hypothetical protein
VNRIPKTESKIEIQPGFSPRPIAETVPTSDDSPSPSDDPDTHSPEGKMEGPVVQRRVSLGNVDQVFANDGIVTFAK